MYEELLKHVPAYVLCVSWKQKILHVLKKFDATFIFPLRALKGFEIFGISQGLCECHFDAGALSARQKQDVMTPLRS